MELVTTRVPVTRLPMRQLGALAVIAILIATMLAVYIGSRQQRLPAPFGVAGNGLVAYSSGGDIIAVDPVTATATTVVAGPEIDLNPIFSRDGTKVAFLRQVTNSGYALLVSSARAGELRTASDFAISLADPIVWSPDGTFLIVVSADGIMRRVEAVGGPTSTVLASGVSVGPYSGAMSVFRPPDGRQIMFAKNGDPDEGLWVMSADGSNPTPLLRPSTLQQQVDWRYAQYSPDGSMIAFPGNIIGSEAQRIFLVNADGTGIRQLSTADGIWVEADLRWSPNGRNVAFNHWQKVDPNGAWTIAPLGVIDVTTGTASQVGPKPVEDGSLFDWSPDGTALIVLPGAHAANASASDRPIRIDVASGASTELDWTVQTNVSWQRVAP